jgi:hypothetical protein
MSSVDQGPAKQSDETSAHCSFCRKSFRDVGPLVEGSDTGSGRVFICHDCAELAINILENAHRVQRGEKPVLVAKFAREMIEISTKALDHLEALSKQRALTGIELEHKQRVEAELEKLRSEA